MAAEPHVRHSNARSRRPLVSVVIATYNRRESMLAAIAGVMDQDLDADLELIVVDNASTDGTEAAVLDLMKTCPRELVYVRNSANLGPAGRNAGIEVARGEFVAFTDSDCVPEPAWLREALAAFTSDRIGIVQGLTEAAPGRASLFSHYIVTSGIDGHFSTSNIVYRRRALGEERFDSGCVYRPWGSPGPVYWEDTDLGWRVAAAGWETVFAPTAVIRHEVRPLRPLQWLMWPRHFEQWPQKAALIPGFRRHLLLGLWTTPISLFFEIALLGLVLALWQPIALLLVLPYAVQFLRTRGLRGRFPPAKLAAHVAWDTVALGSLLAGSVRHRALVL